MLITTDNRAKKIPEHYFKDLEIGECFLDVKTETVCMKVGCNEVITYNETFCQWNYNDDYFEDRDLVYPLKTEIIIGEIDV